MDFLELTESIRKLISHYEMASDAEQSLVNDARGELDMLRKLIANNKAVVSDDGDSE